MPFLGHTRFSLFEPDSTSWRLTRSTARTSIEHYKSTLFSEDRLANRSGIFFNFTLPLLNRAIGSHHVFHVVSYSEELPQKYQELLDGAAETYPWLILDKRTRENRKGTSINTFAKQLFEPGTVYGAYRLDDDDVLGINYFDQVEPYISPVFVRMVVSLGLGVQAFYDGSAFIRPRLEHLPKIALGLLKVCEYNESGELIFPENISHTKTDLKNAMVLDSRQISFLHSFHLTQDTGVDKPDDNLVRRLKVYERRDEIPETVSLNDIFPGVPFVHDAELPVAP